MKDLTRLLRLFRPYWGWIVAGILLSFVALIANIVLMAISGWFIAAMALAGLAGGSMNYFTPAAIIRAMAISRSVGRYLERLITHEATFRLLAELRTWFYTHLEPLAPAGLVRLRSGDLLSRIGGDIDALENFYLRVVVPFGAALLAVPVIVVSVGLYSPLLGFKLLLLLLVAGVLVPLFVDQRSRPAARHLVETKARLRADFVETKQGLGELLVYGAFAGRREDLRAQTQRLVDDQRELRRLEALTQGAAGLSASFAMWAILLIGTSMVASGRLTPPELPMLLLLSLAAFETVAALPLAFQFLPQVRTAASRLFAIVDTPPLVADPTKPVPVPEQPDFEIRNLTFSYPDATTPALQDVSLSLPLGRKLALIGPSGAGKSSLAHLLLRFWPAPEKSIRLAGHDLAGFEGEALRHLFAVVPQQIHLFNTTIGANLRLGDQTADEAALSSACRIAGLSDFIDSLPDGFDTFVGEAGMRLSGGQLRRIGIARAVLKQAPVMILDEPTEGLDPALARKVVDNLILERAGRSLLLITHTTIGLEKMDEIIVLDRGRIVERGTHDALMATSSRYLELQNLLGHDDHIE